ncbi:hypothetical protein NP233_g9554 [Leucocoprinus birnbaumii]|uniref:DUF6570 domain-containing protein n=1 Tax=Leucocoprinus birnbaumii TaxID=56174 RepID=A0AAD5VQQ2_9AGAR|nr:hypothetical protein NP233_g9554 [Leucocoprinus birnbaumii]
MPQLFGGQLATAIGVFPLPRCERTHVVATMSQNNDPITDPATIERLIQPLTKKEILGAFDGHRMFTTAQVRMKPTMAIAIAGFTSQDQNILWDMAVAKKRATTSQRGHVSRAPPQGETSVEIQPPTNNLDGNTETEVMNTNYLRAPSPDTVKESQLRYFDRMSNASVKTVTCCACAHRMSQRFTSLTTLANIPNPNRLKPSKLHHAHTLYNGLLLHPNGMIDNDRGYICSECIKDLKANRLPKLALANNMFIGAIPFELGLLSLAEQLMLGQVYPAVFIVKLYPRNPSARMWSPELFNNGLKGNVASYPLNTGDIADLVTGGIMPPPAALLASTICVAFVGPNGNPERCFPDIVLVRRNRVRDALHWLKNNNPLYADITISEERLAQLPENDVPMEIRSTARLNHNPDMLAGEHDGYVPNDQEFEPQPAFPVFGDAAPSYAVPGLRDTLPDAQNTTSADVSLGPQEDDGAPRVVAYSTSSIVDASATGLTDADLTSAAMANTASRSTSQTQYRIHRGRQFVNEYPHIHPDTGKRYEGEPSNPNHILGAFPMLFPYGLGGIETDREVKVPYEAHVRWALDYTDRRFCHSHYFIPLVFGVIRKRQISRAASLQMSSTDPARKRRTNSHSATQPCERFVGAFTRQWDECQIRMQHYMRSEALSGVMLLWQGLRRCGSRLILAIFTTPSPRSWQVQDIDLDKFDETLGPSSTERAINIARDPVAGAQFSHHIIQAVLGCLFGIQGVQRGSTITRRAGVLGLVESYVGTIEAQNRAALHTHLLLWLQNTPTHKELENTLRTVEFRQRIVEYISAMIHADIDELDEQGVKQLPKNPNASYRQPLDPKTPDYLDRLAEREKELARNLQLHSCSTACLKQRDGRLQCKRGAPFDRSDTDWVEPDGRWAPKRHCSMINGYNPPVLTSTHSNNDIKLVTNGPETKDAAWYLTNYETKAQHDSYNTSALIGKRLREPDVSNHNELDCEERTKSMLTKSLNMLNRYKEFGSPQMAASLIGLPDRYISHHHVPIYLKGIRTALFKQFPELKPGDQKERDTVRSRLMFVRDRIELPEQLRDYRYRGDALENFTLYDFETETYDGVIIPEDHPISTSGPKLQQRIHYRPELKSSRCRIVKRKGHETRANFIGRWFPRNDAPEERELYCAMVMVVFRPWRDLASLRPEGSTFDQEFQQWEQTVPREIRRRLTNVQFYHESMDPTA